jgi:hypothetical protein
MLRLKCFSLLLGARNTPRAGKKFSRADDRLIHAITFRHFPNGFTVLAAEGGWFDPTKKRFVAEQSRQILVTARSKASLRRWCGELSRILGQEELIVVELGPLSTFRARRDELRKKNH